MGSSRGKPSAGRSKTESDWSIKRLPQRYRRLAYDAYEYSSPMHDFQAIVRVDQFGVVIDYPGLWVAVS